MTIEIRPIDPADEAAVERYAEIRSDVMPDNPDSPAHARWEDATYPGEVTRLLAVEATGEAVATGSTGRIWMYGPEFERFWLGIWVLPGARGRGVGSRLYRALSDAARAAGKTGFQTELSEAHAEGHRFLAARGFVEVDRAKSVRLDLAGIARPAVEAPPGFALTTLAARPDLVEGVHRVAIEAFPDIPTGDAPVDPLTLDGFIARDVDQAGIPRDAFFVALDEAGEVAGYASLQLLPGSTTVAWHDMTAVRPAYRGRGAATTLKRATIAWAIDHGLAALETGNDEANAPMRAVNLRLGYRPLPDTIGLNGPLAPTGEA